MNHLECSTIYFNSIVFFDSLLKFNIDIVHNLYKARIQCLTISFPLTIFTTFDKTIITNIMNLINMGNIEEGKELELKFMNSDIRKTNDSFVKVLEQKFEKKSDNGIILLFRNKL